MAAQQKAFPPAYVSMVRAGEIGAALQAVLARTSDFLVRTEAIRQTIASALIYPALLAVVAVLAVTLVLTVVLPQFEPVFRDAGDSLPVSTQIVRSIGNALRDYWWALLLAMASVATGWQLLMQRPGMALRRGRLVLALPIVRDLVGKFEIGRFSCTLGVLLANGVPAPRSLALCGAIIGNRVIAAAVETVSTRFKEGEGLSTPLSRTRRFPSLSIQLIRIGEETGRLEEMLQEIAEIYEQEVQRALERLLALLVPAITITMGIAISPPGLFLLAPSSRQRAVSLCRSGRPSSGARVRRSTRDQAGEARGRARPRRAAGRGCGASRRSAVVARLGASPAAEPRSAAEEGEDT